MNIYIGKLSEHTSEESIKALFGVYGDVSSVKIIKDKITGKPRGIAFVEMPSSDEAQQAITQLNGKEVDGNRLIVNEARPMQSRSHHGSGNRFDNRKAPRRDSGGYGSGFKKYRS